MCEGPGEGALLAVGLGEGREEGSVETLGVADGEFEGLSDGEDEGPEEGALLPLGLLEGDEVDSAETLGVLDGWAETLQKPPVRAEQAAAACTRPYPYALSLPGSPRSSAVLWSTVRTSLAVLVVSWLQIKAATADT